GVGWGVEVVGVGGEVACRHLGQGAASAAACAAVGRAAAIRSTAASSCAAVTNHASNALGGRYTPASSIAWKNARYRYVWAAFASAKFVTGAPPKTTPTTFPPTSTPSPTPPPTS